MPSENEREEQRDKQREKRVEYVNVRGNRRRAHSGGMRLRNGRIYQNKEHPAYDVHMEVACLLPCFPHYAPSITIASDLDVSIARIAMLVGELSKRTGLRIRRGLIAPLTARFAKEYEEAWTVPTNVWPELRNLATVYYERLYSDAARGVNTLEADDADAA